MRYLAIGDIHGCFIALSTLARYVNFQRDDTIITLGDYVDKGENVPEVLDWLTSCQSRFNLIALKGNHDILMLKARNDYQKYQEWLTFGGAMTVQSYRGTLDNVPLHHWEFLEKCQPFFEIDSHFFVHANSYGDLPLIEQPDYMLYWEKLDYYNVAHECGKTMICGHSSQKNGKPLNLNHAICIDTWACGGEWLTCLDVLFGKYWQANEKGETRMGYI